MNTTPHRRGRPRLYATPEEAAAARPGRLAARREHAAIQKRIQTSNIESNSQKPVEILLVTMKQAAEMLAVSSRTIATLVADEQLGSVQVRGSRRIWLDELKRFAATGTKN